MPSMSNFRIPAVALAALLAAHSSARAGEQGLPGIPEASAILTLADSGRSIDFATLAAANAPSIEPIDPQLPPEVSVPLSNDPSVSVADRLPFALDDLMARKTRLLALGAGDWRGAREAVRSLYVSRQFVPIWSEGGKLNTAGVSLLNQLKRAAEDGLSVSGLNLPNRDVSLTSPDRAAQLEVTLSLAAVVYALEATGSRITPASISPLVTPSFEVADPLKALIEVAVAVDPGQRLRDFNPQHPGYRRLQEKLAALITTRSGAVAELSTSGRARTQTDARPPARKGLGLYSGGGLIAAAPASFEPDADLQKRARIEANMEMWRWEPRELGSRRIEINIPEYTLRLYRGENTEDAMRVIVGKPDTPTPVFSNAVKYLLVNPIWRVPESIVRKEMLPKAGGDPSYLEQHGFTVKRVNGQIFVEQPPGEGNALGHLLFMFPNDHAVYLHDTPSRGLFATVRRAYSHGCIRVEAPLRLASEVMGGDARGWSEAKVESLLGPSERWVFLPSSVPIHIEYFTESVDEDGALTELSDIYGLTSKVASTLSRLGQD